MNVVSYNKLADDNILYWASRLMTVRSNREIKHFLKDGLEYGQEYMGKETVFYRNDDIVLFYRQRNDDSAKALFDEFSEFYEPLNAHLKETLKANPDNNQAGGDYCMLNILHSHICLYLGNMMEGQFIDAYRQLQKRYQNLSWHHTMNRYLGAELSEHYFALQSIQICIAVLCQNQNQNIRNHQAYKDMMQHIDKLAAMSRHKEVKRMYWLLLALYYWNEGYKIMSMLMCGYIRLYDAKRGIPLQKIAWEYAGYGDWGFIFLFLPQEFKLLVQKNILSSEHSFEQLVRLEKQQIERIRKDKS